MSAQQGQKWKKEEFGCLITWMEENQELLRGKQIAWHKVAKDEVFSNEIHITGKKNN